MVDRIWRGRGRRFIAAAAALLSAFSAYPQTASPARPGDAAIAEVVVTGSHIPRPAFTSVSPLTTVDSRDIEDQGAMRVEDVIDRLPQATPDQTSAVTNGATGAASVDLRDLGPERTLVLVDGKRLAPGDPTSGEIAPDLNVIPDALVERVDIVTGGASAVYGSDAIAGVVNFIMKKDFTGLKLDVQTGFFNHANDDAPVQSLLIAGRDPIPPRVVDDGLGAEATLVWGANSPDGKGDLTLYGGYRHTDAVPESSRDFSACPLEPLGAGDSRGCSGSTTSPKFSRFIVFDQASGQVAGDLGLDPRGPGDTLQSFQSGPDAFNYAPYQYFQRSDDRYVAGGFVRYRVAPALELYASGMFMNDGTTAQLAPSGLFLRQTSISCANPMLSPAEIGAFCVDAGVTPGGDALLFIGHRDVDGPDRQLILGHRTIEFSPAHG